MPPVSFFFFVFFFFSFEEGEEKAFRYIRSLKQEAQGIALKDHSQNAITDILKPQIVDMQHYFQSERTTFIHSH